LTKIGNKHNTKSGWENSLPASYTTGAELAKITPCSPLLMNKTLLYGTL